MIYRFLSTILLLGVKLAIVTNWQNRQVKFQISYSYELTKQTSKISDRYPDD